MWANAGLLRDRSTCARASPRKPHFEAALDESRSKAKPAAASPKPNPSARVAHAILHSALARTESRGAHFRNDFPKRDDQNFQRHSVLAPDGRVMFEEW